MSERPRLSDAIVIKKGDAKPIGRQKRIPLTVKLEPELYARLMEYSGQFAPRKTHQAILVEALEQFLEES